MSEHVRTLCFAYVANDPMNATDPTGMEVVGDGQKGGTITIRPENDQVPDNEITVPNAFGLSAEGFKPSHPDFHGYFFQYNMGPGDSLMGDVFNNPVPGFWDAPSTTEGSLNSAAPWTCCQGFFEFFNGGIVPEYMPLQQGGRPPGFPAAVMSYKTPMEGVVGGYANVNVALPGHTLQGVLMIYET